MKWKKDFEQEEEEEREEEEEEYLTLAFSEFSIRRRFCINSSLETEKSLNKKPEPEL